MGLGIFASCLFLGFVLPLIRTEQEKEFERRGQDLVREIRFAFAEYVTMDLWVHDSACRRLPAGLTRTDFRQVYEHLVSSHNDVASFQAVGCAPNVTHDERAALEAEGAAYFRDNYPNQVNYTGFTGLEPNPNDPDTFSQQTRSEQPFYFPVRYMEPVRGNEAAFDFDLYSQPSRRKTIERALQTWKPAVTDRVRLVQETDPNAYSVLLMHPGIPLSTQPDLKPRDLASIVIRIPDLLRRATSRQSQAIHAWIYDSTDQSQEPVFMGGHAFVVDNDRDHPQEDDQDGVHLSQEEVSIQNLRAQEKRLYEEAIDVASNEWTIVVKPSSTSNDWNFVFAVSELSDILYVYRIAYWFCFC